MAQLQALTAEHRATAQLPTLVVDIRIVVEFPALAADHPTAEIPTMTADHRATAKTPTPDQYHETIPSPGTMTRLITTRETKPNHGAAWPVAGAVPRASTNPGASTQTATQTPNPALARLETHATTRPVTGVLGVPNPTELTTRTSRRRSLSTALTRPSTRRPEHPL